MAKVLYIAGYGRSGSTLLDLLLGNAPGVFGGGETELLFSDLARSGVCSCGRSYDGCDVWKLVLAKLDGVIQEVGLETLARELTAAESTAGLLQPRSQRRRLARQSGRVWRTFFDAVSEVAADSNSAVNCAAEHSGSDRYTVDSSKTARTSSRRIVRLVEDADLDVAIIHLVRDPRAVVYSENRRGNNDALEAGRRSGSALGDLRPLMGWAMANLAVELTVRRLRHLGQNGRQDEPGRSPDVPLLRIRYEDLVGDPAFTLRQIATFAGLDLDPVIDGLSREQPFDPGHGIRGNRMRRAGPIRLQPDTEWVQSGGRSLLAAGLLVAPLARAYGYHPWRMSPPGWKQVASAR